MAFPPITTFLASVTFMNLEHCYTPNTKRVYVLPVAHEQLSWGYLVVALVKLVQKQADETPLHCAELLVLLEALFDPP